MTHHPAIIPRLQAVVIAEKAYVCRDSGADLVRLSQIETLHQGFGWRRTSGWKRRLAIVARVIRLVPMGVIPERLQDARTPGSRVRYLHALTKLSVPK